MSHATIRGWAEKISTLDVAIRIGSIEYKRVN